MFVFLLKTPLYMAKSKEERFILKRTDVILTYLD